MCYILEGPGQIGGRARSCSWGEVGPEAVLVERFLSPYPLGGCWCYWKEQHRRSRTGGEGVVPYWCAGVARGPELLTEAERQCHGGMPGVGRGWGARERGRSLLHTRRGHGLV